MFGVANGGIATFPTSATGLACFTVVIQFVCLRTPSYYVRTFVACCYCDLWSADSRVVVAVFGVANGGYRHFPYLGNWLSPFHTGYPSPHIYPSLHIYRILIHGLLWHVRCRLPRRSCGVHLRTPSLDVRTLFACYYCDFCSADRRVVVAVFGVANGGIGTFPTSATGLTCLTVVIPLVCIRRPSYYVRTVPACCYCDLLSADSISISAHFLHVTT